MASGQTASQTSSSTGSPYDGPSSGRRRDVHIAGSASGKIVSGKASDTRAAARPATMAVVVLGVETAGMVAVGITGPYHPSPGDPDFGCSKEDGGDLFSSGGELPSLWGYGQQDDRSRRVVYISRSVAQATRRLLERRSREDVF